MIVGLLHFKKFRYHPARYFIYFLVYVWLMSNIGNYTYYFWKYELFKSFHEAIQDTVLKYNYWWFTLFWGLASVSFFAWYFNKILANPLHRKILGVAFWFFLIVSIIVILFDMENFFLGYNPFIDINGAIVIMFCVAFYFIEILQSEKILQFYRDITFYIALGILLFWLITTPLVFFEQYYRVYDPAYWNLRTYIYLAVNLMMYGLFSVGIIVSRSHNHD